MTKFKSTDRDQTIARLDDAALETVIGGINIEKCSSTQPGLTPRPWTWNVAAGLPPLIWFW